MAIIQTLRRFEQSNHLLILETGNRHRSFSHLLSQTSAHWNRALAKLAFCVLHSVGEMIPKAVTFGTTLLLDRAVKPLKIHGKSAVGFLDLWNGSL
ncbi:hypothetical protein HN018_25000 (plasmid) [Lichenicola cladoniae]|uniref:Uncharacterized protein n=1 Tax=Lichenicola cladoniae TaxID=1484109 RepID=A0A6M8HY36_9PROT|nr:hypothetical protein [Lichenicola cladoniae]NPD70052.1 hypothetical protein [Acetobacteraceae bacterium]QKE93443.1 hypothetical protein HN018_25000 [Lichenicola cladoniae]